MEIKTVSIIGLGALGILFGHHLSKRMPKENLRIIADQNRIDRYRKDSLYCNGERCEFNYVSPEEESAPADLLIFAVKYNGLNAAIQAVKNQVSEQTIILSTLNGISSEAIIGQTYGMDNILYCVAQGMDAVKEGNQLTYQNMGLLCFGEREPGIITDRVKKVARFFSQMEIPFETDNDMIKRQWGKLMVNVGVNQTVTVYGSNYGAIQREGQPRKTMILAMREVMALAEKEGITITEEDLNYWLSVLDRLNPEGKPSMLQDIEARRHSEVELFAGTILELGKRHGVATPVNQEFYHRIKALEKQF